MELQSSRVDGGRSKEMESVFKMQMNSSLGKETEKYFLDKMEELGKRKLLLEKELSEAKEKESNVISLDDVRKEFNDRFETISRGWAKLTAVQQKRALKRLIKSMYVTPKGIEIYYYNNSSVSKKDKYTLSESTESLAEVMPRKAFKAHKINSKLKVVNCLTSELVIPVRLERTTLSLEGRCSIQLSYGTI